MPSVVIVGAGISGLSAAYRLQDSIADADLAVLEQAGRPGGTTWTLREAGFQLEIGPNGFLDSKPTTAQLCRDAGLGEQLVAGSEAARKNRYLFLGHGLEPLPAGLGALLRTRLLSWRGKLGLLTEPWRGRPADAGDESIDAFARRRAGAEVAATFADALVTGIYAGDPALLSLPACFPRVAALERDYGSVVKGFLRSAKRRRAEAAARGEPYRRGGQMWSFAGGLRVLVETLAARLKRPPVYGVAVRSIRRSATGRGWDVYGDGNEAWHADAVVLTCPAYRQAELLADAAPEIAAEIAAIAYNRVAVVGLGYRRDDVPGPLDGFGFIAPGRTRRDLLGVQWCSSIYPGRAPDGAVLLRAMCGGWHRAEMLDWPDDRLLGAVRAELRAAMGVTAEPVFHRVIRWDRAIPQYHVGHLDRVARIERQLGRHPGLFLGGNAYHGVALNDCTEQAGELAAKVKSYLAAPPAATA
jgi:protoporphyrinogen/coproporphyrinogen III oxidase